MTILNKINPFRSLYGRIFISFWLATILMVSTAIWLGIYLSQSYEIESTTQRGMVRLEKAAARLHNFEARITEQNLAKSLEKIGRRTRSIIMLVEPKSQTFIYGFPPHMRFDKEPFLKMVSQSHPLRIRSGQGVFDGPINVILNQKTYKMFVGKPFPPGLLRRFHRRYPGVIIATAVFVSGLLCAWFTWSLLRPIGQLQQASRKISEGDLSARVGNAALRSDEIGQLGKDFNRMSEQIEKLMQSQKRLLADISHELRSPLARLQLAIGIAQQQDKEDISQVSERQLQRIETEAHRIEKMLEQVLKLARLEAAQLAPEKVRFNLKELVYELINNAQFEAQSEGKSVTNDLPETEINITGDASLVSSAVENVLRNAVKYCNQHVDVNMKLTEGSVELLISDDGPGIEASQMEDIFVPFYRISQSRNRKTGGVGLGLAIAQQAIHAHDGEIKLKTNTKGGLDVLIILPIMSAIRNENRAN